MKGKLNKIFDKKGFTLIELLVVIGILAVLAAIAIPTVAGLIDRANKSADLTNSNEMTNALERFASEYELYKNDIATGIVPNDDLDTMQGRVFAVTGATTRAEITELETAGNDGTILINDERYPTNDALVKKIVETYTKTSSSTFEPKQSDKCFWYSPECGVVVVAGHNSSVLQKNELIVSGKDAKGNDLTADTQWIDLTPAGDVIVDDENNGGGSDEVQPVDNPIPVGGVYSVASTQERLVGDGVTVAFPETPGLNDVYRYDGYIYRYSSYIIYEKADVVKEEIIGWRCDGVEDKTLSTYPAILPEINGSPIIGMHGTFEGVSEFTISDPNFIPSTVKTLGGTFKETSVFFPNGLNIPNSVVSMNKTFSNSTVSFNDGTLVIPDSVYDLITPFNGAGIHNLSKIVLPKSLTKSVGLQFSYYVGIIEIGGTETFTPASALANQFKNANLNNSIVLTHDNACAGCKTCSSFEGWKRVSNTSAATYWVCTTDDDGATVYQGKNIYTYDAARDVYVVNADTVDTTTMLDHIMLIPVVGMND